MTPLWAALIRGFILFRALGFAVPWFADWQHALRAALGLMFLLTASAHWGKRRPYLIRMVPKSVGHAEFFVTLTGLAEIAIAIGLQIPVLAAWSALGAIAMLCALFPANVKAAREHLTLLDKPVPPVGPRLLAQLVLYCVTGGLSLPAVALNARSRRIYSR
jgi:uncharacterized membrane protein